jgi:excisionase family DNA binding protein
MRMSDQTPYYPLNTGGYPIDPEAERKFQEIMAEARKNEEKFKEKYKGYEPYDLTEIEKIIQKAKNQTKKATNKQKLGTFQIVHQEIVLIIENRKSVHKLLEKESSIDDLDYYYDELYRANNLKMQFEIEINKLQLETAKQTETTVELKSRNPEGNVSSKVNSSIAGTDTSDKIMTVKEVAKYLKVSTSTIYHKVLKNEIPSAQIGKKRVFPKSKIDDWINTGGSKTQPNKGSKTKHHFTFTVSLEPFTNVFVQEEYLDHDNAVLMNDRFSKAPQKRGNLIQWQKDLRSLMTFIYLADRLDFIDKSIPSNVRQHNTSSDEETDEGPEVKFQVLVEENFEIAIGGSSKSSMSRTWAMINDAINKLREQVADKKGIKTYDKKKKITRKETIKYFFESKDGMLFKINNKEIDKKILKITRDISKEENL